MIAWVNEPGHSTIDHRPKNRLTAYTPANQLADLNHSVAEGQTWDPAPWDLETITPVFIVDLEFAIEKAENERGISASLMHDVIRMWLHAATLPEPDIDYGEGSGYGLAFFKAVKATLR